MAPIYNQLFDLVRRERSHQELQDLPAGFYLEAKMFFEETQAKIRQDPYGNENERLQLSNGKKLLRQLYEYREQKILQLAQARCRTGSALVDTARLLPEERKLFDHVVQVLCSARTTNGIDEQVEPVHATHTIAAPKPAANTEEKLSVLILKPVAQFVGRGMESYGPYEENSTVELPTTVANVLIRKGMAQMHAE